MQNALYDIDTSEVLLVQGLQKGEEAAFAQVYEKYFKELYLRAYKILGVAEGAEDAVQETFAALWKYKTNLEIRNLGAYLHRSLHNAALKTIRKNKTDHRFYDRLAQASEQLLNADPVIYKELQAKLISLLKSLPEDQQLIYSLSRDSQLTYQQIAEQLNISVKTVEKKMTLTLKFLRTEIGKALVVLLVSQM